MAVSALGMLIVFGIRLSFSVFFAEFTLEESWSSEASASIFSLNMLAFAVGSVPAGILLDRWGPRPVFSTGALLMSIGLFACSRASNITHIQLAYGGIVGLALAIVGLGPVGSVVARWVPHRRGLAIGLTFAGTGIGSLIFTPLVNVLIEDLGWRGAYRILSLICLLILLPLFAFGQKRPPASTPETRGLAESDINAEHKPAIIRMPVFWWLMLLSATAIGPVRAITVHQVAYMVDVGVARQTAANIVGVAGFLTAFTFILWGYFSDRLGRHWAFGLGALCLVGAIGMLIWMQSSQATVLLIGYAALFALGEGSRSGQTTAIAGDIFHGERLGAVAGAVGAMFGLGAAIAPWGVGYLRDNTDSYNTGFVLVFGFIVVSVVAVLMTRYTATRQRHGGIRHHPSLSDPRKILTR